MTHVTESRGTRYIGDRSNLRVHDTKTETTNCHIDAVLKYGNGVRFEPDQLAEAARAGYARCPCCQGGSCQ